ncbi:TpHN family protein [Theileria parva strain Muguga]|uniref:TashAT2 protein, putative n=1 Tax=Theileria parva TaxID=5875 RepID=Q4N849_THEPA|nr:uncharacterized protein TpMuguga_01g00621 [Theileria parva strain Muguga]EAN33859.1 TpHN family protein [Theileria parva strain Muguga]|eukprot:XP_766142.1 hypothetical protein [Theileria parva strain Muguga]
MFTHHVLIIFLAGILCKNGNVWAEDLDLKYVINSGFSINTTTNNGLIYTEISSNTQKHITRVKNGVDPLWEEEDGQFCMSVTVVSSSKLDDSLVSIEILKSEGFVTFYYNKMGNLYLRIDKDVYDKKIKDMEIVSNSNTSNNVENGAKNDVNDVLTQFDSTDNSFSNSAVTSKHPDHTVPSDNINDSFDDILENYNQMADKHETKSRNVNELEVPSRRILNILALENNDRISYEYELNDGIPSLIVEVLKPQNKRISVVSENEALIWEASGSERLLTVSAHSFYGEYRLVEVIYTSDGSDNISSYYKKYDNQWVQCDSKDFEDSYIDMKSKIEIIGSVVLDVSAQPNSDEFYLKHENSELLKATTFFPLTGYHLKKVIDSGKEVWKSGSKRSTAVTLITNTNPDISVNLLKIEITNDEKDSVKYFMKDNSGNYIPINKQTYNQIIKNPQSYTNQPDDQFLNTDFTNSNIPNPNSVNHINPLNHLNTKKLGMELDILNHDSKYVLQGSRKGIDFKTYLPYEGRFFHSVKLDSFFIWRAQNGQSSSFVRVFFPSATPRLGFINIDITHTTTNTTDNPVSTSGSPNNSDIVTRYFVDDYGIWKFVEFDVFSNHFDFYLQNAVPTPETSGGSQIQTSLKEADPLSFFIFDINIDQNQ